MEKKLLVGALFILFGGLAYTLGTKQAPLVMTPSPAVSPAPSLAPAIEDETEVIKQAIFRLTGLTPAKAEVTISKITGNYATGGIKEYDAVGGAYWLAAKTVSGWVGVYDGQSQPECSQIETYDFPVEMVPECVNASGKVVSR